MAKRFAGAALICALLCVFAGAALSQGATAAAPAPTPENVPAVVDPLAQTPGTANTDAVTNVVITLSTGEWDAKDARKQAALYLLKPLLAGFTGTGATAGLYVMDDKPLILAQNVPLQTETDLNDLYAKLDGLNKVRFPEYASAFDALCSTLYANCVPATADPAEKLSGNTELWMVDLRDPLYFSPEERSNKGGTKADQFSQAMDSLSALMDAMPGLTLHYVYVTGANGLPADGDIADRMDTLLVNRLGNTGRIQIHVLYANDTAQAFDGAMEMIRNHFSAVVPCDSLTPIAEGEAWSFAYDHQPGASTGDALLLISPEASVDSIQVENAALPDVPVYRITWKSGGGGVWLRGAPAGVYRVTLTTQKGSAAPSVSAYRVLAACNVNLGYRDGTDEKAFSSDTVWYRNEHTLLLSTAAAGVPAEDWTPHLIINGYAKDVTFTLVSPAMEGKIVWEASLPVIHRGDVKLEASLSLESGYTLSTGTRTVRVENRAPVVTAGAQNAFRLYYVVGDTKSGIDFNLSGYFSDPDGDPLVYTPDLMPENAGEATVQDGLLHYTPLRATGLTLLTLHARDEHGGHVSTTMQIYQYALSDCLSAWRFALDTQASNNLSGDATAGWTGTLNQPVTLVFALRPETDQNGFYADAQQEWGESVLAGNLTIRLSTLRVNGKLMDNPPDVTVEDQGGRLMASLTLPATTLATEYTLSFTANYGTLSLPNLLAPIEIRFANTPPRLSGLEYTLFTQPIDIGGLPGNYQAVALNAINVASFFADDETPKSLSYALHISGTATCTLNGGQSVYPSGETVVDNIDLAVMEDGICPLALTLLSPGTLNLSITADDGEHNSEAPLTWTVTIVSVFMRTLWYVGLGMLGALLLLALLLVVRYLRLPVFGNVCVSLANVPPETNAIVQPPAEVIPLSFYQKKSVSLLTLMMMYQLAPQPGLDAATADSILLSPARHAHGTDVFVTLLYTRHTSGREIFLDEGVPLMRNKHFVMQREQLVITVRAPEGTGSVRLFFSRQESGDPFML